MAPAARVRILLAVTYRAHREALAGTLRALRPDAEVVEAEPEELDEWVAELRPDIVLCSALTEVVETRVAAWVVLYPDEENRAVFSLDGRCSDTADIGFAALVAFIDEASARCCA